MKEKLTVSCEGKPCYDIVLTIGFEELAGAALSVSTLVGLMTCTFIPGTPDLRGAGRMGVTF